ncbi:MAG: ATP-binding protein [Chloroflexi bacterium]|nr:ATP-binding protein [Chloroflexota bacterium]
MDSDSSGNIQETKECEDAECNDWTPGEWDAREGRIRQKNYATVRDFLSGGSEFQTSVVRAPIYGDLLAAALHRHVETWWQTVKLMGHSSEEPYCSTVSTDYDKHENVVCKGYLLLKRDDDKVVASINTMLGGAFQANLLITGNRKETVEEFAKGVNDLADSKKMYQGKKIELGGDIRFISPTGKSWDDLALSPELKEQIRTNTVDFLARREELAKYGILPRRGVMLLGEPGTGKTLVLKIIMSQSPGVTCISARTARLVNSAYIYDLYFVARDLRPSIVFLEDIDLIGEDRRKAKEQALPTLLAQLDGLAEDCAGVVTVATTNFIEDIDDALKKRPSRFDRVIELSLPDLEQRRRYVELLSGRIPMDEDIRECLARKTEGMTPAQIQEAAQSLVIEHKHSPLCAAQGGCTFDRNDVDRVVEMVRHDKKNGHMGFARAVDSVGLPLAGAHVLNAQQRQDR